MYEDHPVVPSEYVYKLGYCVIVWNSIDFELDAIYMVTMGDRMASDVADKEMDGRRPDRVDKLRRQAEQFLENWSELLAEFRWCVDRYDYLSEMRNELVHGRWSIDNGKAIARRNFVSRLPVTLQHIDDCLAAFTDLEERIGNLRGAIQLHVSLQSFSKLRS